MKWCKLNLLECFWSFIIIQWCSTNFRSLSIFKIDLNWGSRINFSILLNLDRYHKNALFRKACNSFTWALTLSWRRSLSYRNQSKSVDWFLYDRNLRHERVKEAESVFRRCSDNLRKVLNFAWIFFYDLLSIFKI